VAYITNTLWRQPVRDLVIADYKCRQPAEIAFTPTLVSAPDTSFLRRLFCDATQAYLFLGGLLRT
jgi:hypothetical protein